MPDPCLPTPILDVLNRPLPRPATHPDATSVHAWTAAPERRPEPVLLTIAEVAATMRTSEKTVRRRIKDGTIRKLQMGGRLVRIPSDELVRLAAGDPTWEPGNDVDILSNINHWDNS